LDIRIVPLAAESLGTRSMCTYVETRDLRILIDPGASLGPRFGLLPHPKEYEALRRARKQLAHHADLVSVVSISHYHYDHATPTYTDYLWNLCDPDVAKQLYQDKRVLAKDYRGMINPSQRRRGWMLKDRTERLVQSFEPADGQTFSFGSTSLRFSNPVPHGENGTPLGWVIMLTVESGGDVFVHASDIQGPMIAETAHMLLDSRPDTVFIGGPPTYLSEYRIKKESAAKAFDNMALIAEKVPVTILDHHVLREGKPQGLEKVISASEKAGHRVVTAAEYLGQENQFLESERRSLYNEYPPSKEFLTWTKLPERKRMTIPPPQL